MLLNGDVELLTMMAVGVGADTSGKVRIDVDGDVSVGVLW